MTDWIAAWRSRRQSSGKGFSLTLSLTSELCIASSCARKFLMWTLSRRVQHASASPCQGEAIRAESGRELRKGLLSGRALYKLRGDLGAEQNLKSRAKRALNSVHHLQSSPIGRGDVAWWSYAMSLGQVVESETRWREPGGSRINPRAGTPVPRVFFSIDRGQGSFTTRALGAEIACAGRRRRRGLGGRGGGPSGRGRRG